jgi:transcriptional regulator with XRE-family HTH domain
MARTVKATLGQKLLELRQERKASLRAVAKAAKISPTYLSQLERDLSKPTDGIVFNLAGALECNEDELLAIGGRIAKDLEKIILQHPPEVAALLLAIEGLPPVELKRLTDQAMKRRTALRLEGAKE